MNSIHDMGGMHGLGPLVIEPDEPLFHAEWVARVVGLNPALAAWGIWNVDAFRQRMERIPAIDYLHMAYYEKWLTGFTALALEAGLITQDELATGRPAPGTAKLTPALAPAAVVEVMDRGGPKNRPAPAPALFVLGARVLARNTNPVGHTRVPRYVRGRVGQVIASHGAHVYPDTNAAFRGEDPRHLYTVRFTARELWGEAANPRDSVSLEMWEPYLDHA